MQNATTFFQVGLTASGVTNLLLNEHPIQETLQLIQLLEFRHNLRSEPWLMFELLLSAFPRPSR